MKVGFNSLTCFSFVVLDAEGFGNHCVKKIQPFSLTQQTKYLVMLDCCTRNLRYLSCIYV